MTSATRTVSPVEWLSAALGRLTVVTPRPRPVSEPRHRAPIRAEEVAIATPEDLKRSGRHMEPEWSRAQFDAARDTDALEWLGFSPRK